MTYLEKIIEWAQSRGYVDGEARLDSGRDRLILRLERENDILEINLAIKRPVVSNIKKRKIQPGQRTVFNNFLPLIDLSILLEGSDARKEQ